MKILTPKEKAKELIHKFYKHSRKKSNGFLISNEDMFIYHAKESALICVREMESHLEKMFGQDKESSIYLLELEEEIKLF